MIGRVLSNKIDLLVVAIGRVKQVTHRATYIKDIFFSKPSSITNKFDLSQVMDGFEFITTLYIFNII